MPRESARRGRGISLSLAPTLTSSRSSTHEQQITAVAAVLPSHVSAFTAPSCLPQAVLSLRSATTTAPTMVSRRDTLVIAGTTGASWMFGQQAAYAKTGGGAAAKKAPAKPVQEEEEEEEEEDTTPAGFQELKEGLKYKVVTEGKGAKAKIGDLVAIRFKSSYNGQVIDDCFKTPNSYYYRVGSENVIQVRVCARACMHACTHARSRMHARTHARSLARTHKRGSLFYSGLGFGGAKHEVGRSVVGQGSARTGLW